MLYSPCPGHVLMLSHAILRELPHAAWMSPCSLDVPKLHGYPHVPWMSPCSVDVSMFPGCLHVPLMPQCSHAPWMSPCCLDIPMLSGCPHAVWMSPCFLDVLSSLDVLKHPDVPMLPGCPQAPQMTPCSQDDPMLPGCPPCCPDVPHAIWMSSCCLDVLMLSGCPLYVPILPGCSKAFLTFSDKSDTMLGSVNMLCKLKRLSSIVMAIILTAFHKQITYRQQNIGSSYDSHIHIVGSSLVLWSSCTELTSESD